MGWLATLFGGGKKQAPPQSASVQKVPGYLGASDLRDEQSITLTIRGTHLPGPDVEGAWREFSFWEVRDRMICTQAIRQTLLDAYGEDWNNKRVHVCKTQTEIAGPPTYGLRVLPVKEDMGKTHTCGRCGYKGDVEEFVMLTPTGPTICIKAEHCTARVLERAEKIRARADFLSRIPSDNRRQRARSPWWGGR